MKADISKYCCTLVTTERLGGGAMTATTTRNAPGQLTSLKTMKGSTQIRNMDFVFDAPTGNLTSRTGMFAQQEMFEYDNLDRLTTAGAMSMSYAANGNITGKTGLGEYSYGDGAGPHALTGVEDPDGLISSRTQTIEYNAFKKASVLIDTVGNDAYRLEIIYGPDGQRWKTALQKNGNITKTVIFAGDYEKVTEDGVTRELVYLPGGGIYVRQAGQPDKVYYAHTDHLGSIVSITDGAGTEVFKASYDVWGKQTVTNSTFKFHRGYTGHEHLEEFGLINMNGRMYDPLVGRFLSPDPFVQAPGFSQSYNRYSYALNNPLIYTDPTGEFFFAAVGIGALLNAICWGAAIGAATYTASVGFSDGGFNNWNWGDFGKSAGIGALSGAATFGIGQMFGPVGSMGFGGEVARAYTHGFAQGMISGLTGGDFMSGFAAGGLGSLAGSAFMMYGGKFANSIAGNYAFSGLAGGVGAELTGGNFWEGAATGLMVAGLNHIQQGIAMPKKLEEKIDEAWAQERARRAREDAPRSPYDVEPVSQYIDGVDFEIGRPYGNREGVKYVYETTIDGVKVRADIYYSSSTKNKMVQLLKYDRNIAPGKTGGYGIDKAAYTVRFLPKGGWDIGRMSFGSMSQYQQYLRSKLY